MVNEACIWSLIFCFALKKYWLVRTQKTCPRYHSHHKSSTRGIAIVCQVVRQTFAIKPCLMRTQNADHSYVNAQ